LAGPWFYYQQESVIYGWRSRRLFEQEVRLRLSRG
jgi:hypothetical protein